MKVRITFTVDVSDEDRRAIARHRDEDDYADRIADREEVRDFFEEWGVGYGSTIVNQQIDLLPEYEEAAP